MATMILQLHADPLLGRIHAINRKHRLRDKHYAAIEDWPESGYASIKLQEFNATREWPEPLSDRKYGKGHQHLSGDPRGRGGLDDP